MERLFLEDFRCFDGKRDIRLAPITILIGENSTGKSSFLAAVRAAWDITFGKGTPDFNEDPFDLGAFEQIANFRARKTGRSDSFQIGATHSVGDQEFTVVGTFSNADSQPALSSWSARSGSHEVLLEAPVGESPRLRISPDADVELSETLGGALVSRAPLAFAIFAVLGSSLFNLESGAEMVSKTAIGQARAVLEPIVRRSVDQPHAFAPIRSRPERTYDPRVAPEDSFGGHVPLALRQVLKSKAAPDQRSQGCSRLLRRRPQGCSRTLRFAISAQPQTPSNSTFTTSGPIGTSLTLATASARSSRSCSIPSEANMVRRSCSSNLKSISTRRRKRSSQVRSLAWYPDRGLQAVIETHSDFILDRLRIEARSRQEDQPSGRRRSSTSSAREHRSRSTRSAWTTKPI